MHLYGAVHDLDRFAKVADWQVEQFGELRGERPGVPVGCLDRGEHEVDALDALDGGGEQLGGAERIRAGDGVVADEDGLVCAHRQRLAEPGDLAVRGHRHEGDLTVAGGGDELECHLDAVGVGLVEDELARSVEGVVGFQGTRFGWVRNLFHGDDHVHG